MDSRRNFLGKVATGLAGTLASPNRVLGANERIRIGVIGAGDRGTELTRLAMECPGAEVAACADIYSRRRTDFQRLIPTGQAHVDYRYLLEDKSIDAVIIATPQHLHAEQFVAAIDAGKDVYQEKTMAFTVEHAKRMRAAYQRAAGKRTVQIGHQSVSSGQMADAVRFLTETETPVGKITSIRANMFRNSPHGKPQWARPVYPDMTPENILWNKFRGEAPERAFEASRFVNWRYFWDYSGGNVYENMCHQLAFWYKAMNLQIPKAATMTGGVYLWKDGREVPDTMSVTLEQPEEMLFSWNSGFGNDGLGVGEDVLGTDGTISKTSQIRWTPQKVNVRDAQPVVGQSKSAPNAHMQNFLESIRTGKEPNCPFDVGFRTSIACRMAVESYRQHRTVRWDPAKEEIV